jgi:putative FmdB family regulatory protein
MPTYSYKCSKCLHEFTQLNSISNSEETKCPECNQLAKKVFGFGCVKGIVAIKGKGFYQESKLR